MGTSVQITATAQPALDQAVAEVEALLRRFEVDYYAWGDGELARLNDALARQDRFPASPELAQLLSQAQSLSDLSHGRFEPAIAPLVEAWGFHDASTGAARAPSAEVIAALISTAGSISQITIEDSGVYSGFAGPKLDLGGIAKGYAVDLVVKVLLRHGIDSALINAGGDLRVLGSGPGRNWRVGVQSPRTANALGVVELAPGEAAFTSGDYERFFDADNGRMHHLLDPATGFPATHTQAVTVLADNGTLADAAATAIFVAGETQWRATAAALGIEAALRIDEAGRIHLTPAMRDRLQISPQYQSDILPPDL